MLFDEEARGVGEEEAANLGGEPQVGVFRALEREAQARARRSRRRQLTSPIAPKNDTGSTAVPRPPVNTPMTTPVSATPAPTSFARVDRAPSRSSVALRSRSKVMGCATQYVS